MPPHTLVRRIKFQYLGLRGTIMLRYTVTSVRMRPRAANVNSDGLVWFMLQSCFLMNQPASIHYKAVREASVILLQPCPPFCPPRQIVPNYLVYTQIYLYWAP